MKFNSRQTLVYKKKIELLLQPAKVRGHSLVRATVSNTSSSGVDDAPQ